MVGSAVATMVWSKAARNIVSIRLIRIVRTSFCVSGARGASGGASLRSSTSVGIWESSLASSSDHIWWSAGCRLCRPNLFISGVIYGEPQRARGMVLLPCIYAAKPHCGSGLRAWVHPAEHNRNYVTSAQTPWRLSRPRNFSGFWPLFEPRPLRQQRRPLHDVILEIGIRDLVLGALHPSAHGNAGLMHGVGIARHQRMPPIEIAALGDQFVAAAWRQPVAIRNLVRAVLVVLAGAQPGIQQFAGDVGEIDIAGILVLKLLQAAA